MATEVNIPGPACDTITEGSVHMEDQVTQISLDKFPLEKIQKAAELELHRTKVGTILETVSTGEDQREAINSSTEEKLVEKMASEETPEEMINQNEGANKDEELISQKQGDVSNNQNETSENKASEKGDETVTMQTDSLENPVDSYSMTELVTSHNSPKAGDETEELLPQIRGPQIAQDEQSEQERRCTEVSGKDTSDSQLTAVQETTTKVEELKKTELRKTDNGETSSGKTDSKVEKTVESLHEAPEDTEASGLSQEMDATLSSDQSPPADPQINLDDDKPVDGVEQQATVDSDEKIHEEFSKLDGLQVIGDQNTDTSASDQAQNPNATPRNERMERSIDLADVEEVTLEEKNVAKMKVTSLKPEDDSQIKHEDHIEKEIGKQSSTEEALIENANDMEALTLQDSQIGDEYLRGSEHVDTEKSEESTSLDKEIAHPTKSEDKACDSNEDAEHPSSPEKLILTGNDQEITMRQPNDAPEEDSTPEADVRQIEKVKHLETETANSLLSDTSTMEINDDKSIAMHEGQSEDKFVQTIENSDGEKDSCSVLSNKEQEVTSMGTIIDKDMNEEFPSKSEASEKDNQEEHGAATTPGNSELLSDLAHESVNKAAVNKEGDEAASTTGQSELLSVPVHDSVAEVEELKKGELGESDNMERNAGNMKQELENTVEYSNIGSQGSEESGSGQGTCSAKDQHPTSDAQGVLDVKAVNEAEQIVETSELKGAIDPIEKTEEKSGNVDDSQVERSDSGDSSNVVKDTKGTTNDDESTLTHVIKTEDENLQLSESFEYDQSKEIALLDEVHTKDPVIDHGELEDDKITDGNQNTESSNREVPENEKGIPSEQTNEGSIVLAGTEETGQEVVKNDATSMLEGDSSELTHDENVKNDIDSESLTEPLIENVNDEEASTMNEPQNSDEYSRESENRNNEKKVEINPESEDKKVPASPEGTKQIGDECSRESEYVDNEKDVESDPVPEINKVHSLSEGTEQTGDAHMRESGNLNEEKNVEIYPEQEDNRLLDSNEGTKEIGDKFLRESEILNSEKHLGSNPEPEVNKIHASSEGTEQHRDEYGEYDSQVMTINKTNDAACTELNAEVDGSQITDEKESKSETETSLGEASSKEINDVETLVINEGQSWEDPIEDSTQKLPLEEKIPDEGHVFLTEEQNPTVDPQGITDSKETDAVEKALKKVDETTTRGFREDSIQISESGGETCIRDEGIIETVLMGSKKVTESELIHNTSVDENNIDSQKTASDDVVTSTEGHQTETYSINEQFLTDVSQENTSDVAETKTEPDVEESPKDDATADILDRDGECHSHNLEKDVESSENHDDEQTVTHDIVDANPTKAKSFINETSTENISAVESSVKSSPEERDEINKTAPHQDSETLLEEQSPTENPEEIIEDQVESNKYVVDCSQVKADEHSEKDVESSNNHDDEPTITHELVEANSTKAKSFTHETRTGNILAIEENFRSLPEETDLINRSASHQERGTEESKPYEVEIKEEKVHDKLNVLTSVEGIQENSITTAESAFERSTENVSEQSHLTETSKENVDDESSSVEKGEYINDKENCDDEGKDNRDIQDIIATSDRGTEGQSNERRGDTEEDIVQVNKESETTSNELKMLGTCSEMKTDETAVIVEKGESGIQGLDGNANSTTETTNKTLLGYEEYPNVEDFSKEIQNRGTNAEESESNANTSDEMGNESQLQSVEEFTISNITSIEAKEQLLAESLSHDLISEASSETGKLSDANEKEKPCAEYDNNEELGEDEAPKDPEKLLSHSLKGGINEVIDNGTDTETAIASETPKEYHEPQQTAAEGSLKEIASEIKPNDTISEENFESKKNVDEEKDATKVELEQKTIVEEDVENQSGNTISELQQTAEEESPQEVASEIKPNDIVLEHNFESNENMDLAKDATKVEPEEKIIVEEDAEIKSVNVISQPQQTADEKIFSEIAAEIKPNDIVQEEHCESSEHMQEAKDATKVELEHKTRVEEDTENKHSGSYDDEVTTIESKPEGEITKEDEAMTKETNDAIKNQDEKFQGFNNYIETDDNTIRQAEIFSPANDATNRTESEKEKGAIVKEVSDAPDTEEGTQGLLYHKSIEDETIIKQEEQERAPKLAEQGHCDIKQTEKHEKTNDEKLEGALAEKNSYSTEPKEASHGSDEKMEIETSSGKTQDEESKINKGECHLNISKEELIKEVHSTDQSQHDGFLDREAAFAVIQNANEDEKALTVSEEDDIKVAEEEEDAIDANDLTSIRASPAEQEKLGKDLETFKQVQSSVGISKDEEDKAKQEKPIQETMETKTEDLEAKEIAQIDHIYLSNKVDPAALSSTDRKEIAEPELSKILLESPAQEPEVITKAELVQTIEEETAEPESDDTSSKMKQSKEDDLHHLDIRKQEITTYTQPKDETEETSEGKEMNLVTGEEIVGEVCPKESIVHEDISTLDTQEKAPSSDQGNPKDEADGPISSNIETEETLEPKDTDINVETVSEVQSCVSETKEAITEEGLEAVAVEILSDKNPVEKSFDASNTTDEEAENPTAQISSEKSEEKDAGMGSHCPDPCKKELITESKLDQEQENNFDAASEKLDCNEQNTLETVSNVSKDSQYDIHEGFKDEVLQSESLPATKSLVVNKTENDVPLASVESNSSEAIKEEETLAPAQAEHAVPEDYADSAKPKTSIGNENISVIQHEASSEHSQGQCEAAQSSDLGIEKPSLPQESLKMKGHSSDNKDPIVHSEYLHEKGQNQAGHEDVNTDEEKDDKAEESGEHTKYSSGPEALVMVDAGDLDVKAPHKKTHNLLSGVGSKVKHSIAKVKKAITGKSSHHKLPSTKQN